MFRKKTNIDDVHSCLRVGEKYIAYYSSDFILRLLDSELLAPKFEHQFSRDFDFNVHEGCLYLSIDSELFSLNIVDPKLEKVCQTDNQYITALSGSRYLASSYRRKDKQYDNLIFDESCKLLWELNGEMSFRDIYETHLLLSDRRGNKIGYLNFENCEILWQHELIERISGESIETKKSIVVPISSSLVAFNRGTGDKEWENDFSLSDYKYDDLNKKLYGLGGNNFEVVNVETGEIEIKKELSEKLHISSHLTSYDSGLLYFSAYRENNIPIFGAVNVDNGELVFTQEVEMPGEKSFRKGLDRPVVVGNRLYVRDAMKTLHVYEREAHLV